MHKFEIIEIADSFEKKNSTKKSARSTITTIFSEIQVVLWNKK